MANDDERFDWRDPNMAVIRERVITAEQAQNDSIFSLQYGEVPFWRIDPTYSMRRKK